MANQPVTSAFSTSATENDVILSIVQDQLLREVKLPPTVMDMSSNVKKGDKSFDVPKFTAAFAGPATQNPDGLTETEFQAPTFGVDSVLLDQWKTLPYRVPDRASMQSSISVEAELAKSAGQEMAIFVDDRIIARLKAASAAAPDHLRALDGTATAGVGAAITLAAISKCRELLSRQNLPQSERYLVIPPEQEKEIIDLVQPITMNVGRLAGLALRARDKEASVVEIREELKLLLTRLGAHTLHLMEAKCVD